MVSHNKQKCFRFCQSGHSLYGGVGYLLAIAGQYIKPCLSSSPFQCDKPLTGPHWGTMSRRTWCYPEPCEVTKKPQVRTHSASTATAVENGHSHRQTYNASTPDTRYGDFPILGSTPCCRRWSVSPSSVKVGLNSALGPRGHSPHQTSGPGKIFWILPRRLLERGNGLPLPGPTRVRVQWHHWWRAILSVAGAGDRGASVSSRQRWHKGPARLSVSQPMY